MQAVLIYQGILRYMGDMPGRQSRVGIELTDLIFDGPLKQASTCVVYFGWMKEPVSVLRCLQTGTNASIPGDPA